MLKKFLNLVWMFFLFVGNANAGCIEQTSEKHVLTGKIASSYLENSAAFILFEADNNKYTFPVNADKLIETRNLIGDVVSLGYVEKQYWDEYEEMCVNAVDVVEIKSLQSALQEPVERVLGNGNLEGTLLDVGEDAGFCYITIQESFEKSHLPINCGEMSSYVSLRGKDVTVTFTVNQYYYEPDDVWMKDFQIQKIVEW